MADAVGQQRRALIEWRNGQRAELSMDKRIVAIHEAGYSA